MGMGLRKLMGVAGLALLAAGAAWSAEPLKIGALLSVTGPASGLGGPEKRTIEMLAEELNAKGGVLGRPIQVIFRDTGGEPEKAVAFAKQLIEENRVLAILGPSTSGETMKVKALCDENKTLLLSCAAAEVIVNPIAPYVFKTPQSDAFAVKMIYGHLKAAGLKKVGITMSNDGFGKAGRDQLKKLAPEFGLEIVADESYEKSVSDLTSVVTKLKASGAEAVVNWTIVDAQSILPKNMKQAGYNVPLYQSHGFGNLKYVEAAGAAAEGILFPCGRLLVAEALSDSDPQKKLLVAYKQAYEARYKETASSFGGHGYDAFLLLVEGLKKAGVAESAKVREALENLKGVPGTAGVFSFSPTDHNGLTMDAFVMLTVKNGQFVLCGR